MKKIYIIATFDTKSLEANYIKQILKDLNLPAITVDISTSNSQTNPAADIQAATIASFHPEGSHKVFCGDRGPAVAAMTTAFSNFIQQKADVGAILGIGGSGGTAMITRGMQELAIGIPKIMLSTMACGDISGYVGASDIAMQYSVTDFVGLNSISTKILANAAGAIAGAYTQACKPNKLHTPLPAIGVTMFGVTTPAVESITQALHTSYDCIVFHATGAGGQSMEKLLDDGFLEGLIDITTTEVCDHLFGGVLACTEDRFGALARTSKPAVISCGALDMVNFGAYESVPAQFKSRLLYKHNAEVTLMRTSPAESAEIGAWIANKLNKCDGEIRFIIPEGGVSALDAPNQAFWDPEADEALFAAIADNFKQTEKHKLIQTKHHINSKEFAEMVINQYQEITKLHKSSHKELECQNITE